MDIPIVDLIREHIRQKELWCMSPSEKEEFNIRVAMMHRYLKDFNEEDMNVVRSTLMNLQLSRSGITLSVNGDITTVTVETTNASRSRPT